MRIRKVLKRIINRNDNFAILCVIVLLLLSGCGGDENADLEQYVDQIKARPGLPIEPLPQPKVVPKFVYKRDKRPSPFFPVEKKEEGAGEALSPDMNRAKQPLEAYPMDSLALVGKVNIDGIIWALIESADGHVHRICSGQYMGKNYGKVVKISQKEITVEETVRIANRWRKRMVTLKLRTEGGE